MTSKRIFVYASMRSATQWLHDMFLHNVDSGELDLDVRHEAFRRTPMLRLAKYWESPGIHIAVGYDGPLIEWAYERFPDLQVAMLVRDPIDQLTSIFSMEYFPHIKSNTGAFMTGAWHWGALETVLAITKALGIDMRVWHFDYYTTLAGFKELSKSLGLTLNACPDLLPPKHSAEKNKRFVPEELGPGVVDCVRKMHSHLPLLSAAYAEAKAYADERLIKIKAVEGDVK